MIEPQTLTTRNPSQWLRVRRCSNCNHLKSSFGRVIISHANVTRLKQLDRFEPLIGEGLNTMKEICESCNLKEVVATLTPIGCLRVDEGEHLSR